MTSCPQTQLRSDFYVVTKVMKGENVFTSIKRTPVGKMSSLVTFECMKTHPEFKSCSNAWNMLICAYVDVRTLFFH